MKFKNEALLLMGETAAFGWFILRGLSFILVLPLLLFGWLFYRLMQKARGENLFCNGLTALAAALIGSILLSVGLFQGNGFFSLFFLLIAIGLFSYGIEQEQLLRISRWWSVLLAVVFLLMLLGGMMEIRWQEDFLPIGEWWEIAVFYLLAFLEPLSLGKRYARAPLMLSFFLLPFGIVAWLSLGGGAFLMAEFPYLSVWSGVSFFSIRHIEGIILGFYYGAVSLRIAEFLVKFKDFGCNKKRDMIK